MSIFAYSQQQSVPKVFTPLLTFQAPKKPPLLSFDPNFFTGFFIKQLKKNAKKTGPFVLNAAMIELSNRAALLRKKK